MKILQEVDAEGVLARAKKSFKRRRYGSKVILLLIDII